MNTNYTSAIIFTKHTNLMPWFNAKYYGMSDEFITSVGFNQFKHSCEKLRDVQLILLVRYDGIHTYCKIKCPISPLPIKGEFEAVSRAQIVQFLKNEGWVLQQNMPISLLK